MTDGTASDGVFRVPALSLVVLVGASGSGKSTLARTHFLPTEVLSSDTCRGLVSDDTNDQTATRDAFDVLQFVAARRLARGRLTVVDATNVQAEARRPYVALAREYHVIPVAIVLDLPEKLCVERNSVRPDRAFHPHVVHHQATQLRRSFKQLKREGFRHVLVLTTPEEVAALKVERQPLWNDLRHESGPFDVIGDVHGCFDELTALLAALGWQVDRAPGRAPEFRLSHPAGRKLVFLGDLVDRGPATPAVLRLAMDARAAGVALCVPGNHDVKLMKKLTGRDVKVTHGLAESLAQLERETPEFRAEVATFVDALVSHYVLDGGKLVVAHAGMKASMQGRGSGRVRDFALYGETTGETDAFGLPVRYDWAAEYRGAASVVYGHTPVAEPEWLNRTICVDTGCVFGGKLTAVRWPERELVSVPAARAYYEAARPFLPAEVPAAPTAQQQNDQLLDLTDVTGKRIVTTALHRTVTVRAENAAAALEAMSRFAIDPRWLVYLPPTMSPVETCREGDLLERPAEAFAYFRKAGVERVICEEKHMGSRAVLAVCRDADAARRRFGVEGDAIGACWTRTGRAFFEDAALEAGLLARVRDAALAGGLFDALETDWLCLDAELMPWSAKARELVRTQYAAVGAAGEAALSRAVALLSESTTGREGPLIDRQRARLANVRQYRVAYRHYCWPVASLADLRLAPFHLLASEGRVHADRDHVWHLDELARACRADPALLVETPHRVVDLTDAASVDAASAWWDELTARGGEGMVVKPLAFTARGPKGLIQPAVKCRGREYLRIIYGPDYTLPDALARLRERGLAAKRSLALREFALSIEGLERFVRRDPLRRVHECAFALLALESEPVDPRL